MSIDHQFRMEMGLDMNEYVFMDYVYRTHTSPKYGGKNDGWCIVPLSKISAFIGLSTGALSGIAKRMVEKGILEVDGKRRRTTEIWWDHYESSVQNVNENPATVQNVNEKRSECERDTILYKDKSKENTPPAVGAHPADTQQPTEEPTTTLKEEKKNKGAARPGADNEPKELATVFDLARKELLGVGGMDWKQVKEHKNLKELVAALGRKAPPKEGEEYDIAKKKQYLRRFLEIASADDFIKRNFTPSILYSMMNKIFTEHELKKQEAKKTEEMPYHQKFDHQTSGFSKELAAKKKI